MHAELKQKWVEALRSGQYTQGKGVLRTGADRFCCLGVLCDLVDPSGWGQLSAVETCVDGRDMELDAYSYEYREARVATSLPNNLREIVGLQPADMRALIQLNDFGRSFETIAQHIEVNIPAE